MGRLKKKARLDHRVWDLGDRAAGCRLVGGLTACGQDITNGLMKSRVPLVAAMAERKRLMMRLIRVFPRKTKATPDDALAYFGPPDRQAEADEVHVSVTFTYDKAWAEHLAEQWKPVAPVKIGGVAYGDRGEGFVPTRAAI
jgi:hypothetical protein